MIITTLRTALFLFTALTAAVHAQAVAKDELSSDYLAFREKALKTTMTDLHIKVEDREPFGVVADISLPVGVMTVVVFKNGDASMYNSQGGYRSGGATVSEEIRRSVEKVWPTASTEMSHMKKTSDFGVVAAGHFRAYVLTRAGIFSDDSDKADPNTAVYRLVRAINPIITGYRHLEPSLKGQADD